MLTRGISPDDVKKVMAKGELIEEYPNDSPFPSLLLLDFIDQQPIHVVVAHDTDYVVCIVVTVYKPDLNRWQDGFKCRREV